MYEQEPLDEVDGGMGMAALARAAEATVEQTRQQAEQQFLLNQQRRLEQAQQARAQQDEEVINAASSPAPAGPDNFSLANEAAAEPLDISQFHGTPPYVPQQPSSPFGLGGIFDAKEAKRLIPLTMLLPIIAKTGGRGAVAALLRGYQNARAERQAQGRTVATQARQDAQLDLQQKRLEYEQQKTEAERQADARRWLTVTLPSDLETATTPHEREAIRQQARQMAGFWRLDPSVADAAFNAAIGKAKTNKIRKRVEGLAADSRSQAHKLKASLTVDGEVLPYETWSTFDARFTDPQTGALVEPPKKEQKEASTEFESFFEKEYLPAVVERREAAGNTKPFTRAEIRDFKLDAHKVWTATGRAPSERTTDSGAQRDRDVSFVRQRIREALVAGKGVSDVARKYRTKLEGFGVDFDAVVATERRALRRQDMSDAGARQRFIESGGDESELTSLDSAFDEALGAGEGATAGAQAPPAAPPRGSTTVRTASSAEVQAVAAALKVSYDEAKRQLEARGVKVK